MQKGLYKDVSEFMVETLELRLRPDETHRKLVEKMEFHLKTNPALRRELNLK